MHIEHQQTVIITADDRYEVNLVFIIILIGGHGLYLNLFCLILRHFQNITDLTITILLLDKEEESKKRLLDQRIYGFIAMKFYNCIIA